MNRKRIFYLEKVVYIRKKQYLCSRFVKVTIMVQAQPTLQSVLSMAYMLPIIEQRVLIDKVQSNLYEQIYSIEDPSEEEKTRLREAYRQAAAGEIVLQSEAHQMMRKFVQQHCD